MLDFFLNNNTIEVCVIKVFIKPLKSFLLSIIYLVLFLPNQVPANTDSVMCFGPLVPNGYAICYNPQADHVHFSITAFNCCEETNAEKLALTLKDTLCQLQKLLQPTM